MKNNSGFTLIEVFIGFCLVASLALGGLAVWAIIHFIAKYW